jgi:hypothetical protein
VSDPLRGQYTQRRYFRDEFLVAQERLRPLGGKVTPGVHDYEAFVYEAEGVRLIFYPHKTSAGNYHIRVRTGGKCNPAKVKAAIYALAENSCTFQYPADNLMHQAAVWAALARDRAAST